MKRKTKRSLLLLLPIPLFFLFFSLYVPAKERIAPGILLDCARRYYSLKELKKYVDLLSFSKHSFLHLHLTDDENVGIECLTLSQSANKAVKRKGRHYNPNTGKPFLTYREIEHLLDYARRKGVSIIPEIDLPAHAGGFLRLLEKKEGRASAEELSILYEEDEAVFDLSNPEAEVLIRSLYKEYAKAFKGCSVFHIGCDEVFQNDADKILSHINKTASFLSERGFHVRIWNDPVTKKNLRKIDPRVQIAYWSLDGDTEDSGERRERRLTRASLPDLQKAARSVLNYNSYYLYYIPSQKNSDRSSLRYMVRDLQKHWSLGKWDGEHKGSANSKYIIGAAISVWGEDSYGVKSNLIFKQTKALFRALVKKIGQNS